MLKELSSAPARYHWIYQGLPPDTLAKLHLSTMADPLVDSHFKLGSAAQTSIGLSALSAAYFHELRTGQEQDVTVDARHALLEFSSEKYYTLDGALPQGKLFDELSDIFKTKDGYVRLHANFPHHKQGLLDILQCPPDKKSVAAALATWGAFEFETEVLKRNLCAGALRTIAESEAHPQGAWAMNVTALEITKIGDAPKREVADGQSIQHPLDGIRVLDLTRVLAGPVCGRTLAAHGADVLFVTSPNLPSLPYLDAETTRGKRTTQLDLNVPADKAKLQELVKDADVFLQSYRPGGLEGRGFGFKEVAAMRPGIIHASVSAFWYEGPLRNVKAFDSVVQTVSGFNAAEADAYKEYVRSKGGDVSSLPPYRALPMQALDHAAGYLLAFGINAALCKTITEGGSWRVHISLGATMNWIRRLGILNPYAFEEGMPLPPSVYPPDPEVAALSVAIEQEPGDDGEGAASGRTMTVLRHAAIMSKTPVKVGRAPLRLNAHRAEWLPRS
ncbi:CoA-transferase family III [Artomyces pyxidatus]|uniref:CoA-transferase family III n=1 Tax=Artomyces pyxidatus TaxID=48021 RepID=A0ACB8SYU0_9AGAM|nr:CoA-transferase family III [Artomyces pyxidatus]